MTCRFSEPPAHLLLSGGKNQLGRSSPFKRVDPPQRHPRDQHNTNENYIFTNPSQPTFRTATAHAKMMTRWRTHTVRHSLLPEIMR